MTPDQPAANGEHRSLVRWLVAGVMAATLWPWAAAGCAVPTDPGAAPARDRSPVAQETPLPDRPADVQPLLIKHGQDIPSPAFVRSNKTAMERSPFDGVIVQMPRLSNRVARQQPVAEAAFARELAPIRDLDFTTLKHNFVIVYATPSGDLFGDWSVPISNWANLARAARAAGLRGIVYDNEEYFGRSADHPAGCPGRTLADCQTQAQLRGAQVMASLRQAWPDIQIMSLYGPWISDPLTAERLSPTLPYNDVSFANDLMGPFAVGLVQGTVGSRARYIDGGEIYTARTPEQFATIRQWQRQGFARESPLVPDSLRRTWSTTVSSAFGVYDRPWLGVPMNDRIWAGTLTHALRTSDRYVWAYTERYDWWRSDNRVPDSWVRATWEARTAAGMPSPGDARRVITSAPPPGTTGPSG